MVEKGRRSVVVWCAALIAVWILAKLHFFTDYDPRDPLGYVAHHWFYWVAFGGIALVMWLGRRR